MDNILDLNQFRDEVINLYTGGMTIRDIAIKFNIYDAVVSFLIKSSGLSTKIYVTCNKP